MMDKNELMIKADKVAEQIGSSELLEALLRAMSTDELESNLSYICRVYEIAFDEDDYDDED